MSSDTDNPYAASISEARGDDHRSRCRTALAGVCRIALAGVSFLVGGLSLLLGAYACALLGWLIATEPITAIRDFMIVGCSLFLGFGTAWIIGGWYYWRRRYLCGVIANGIGVLISVIINAIMEYLGHG